MRATAAGYENIPRVIREPGTKTTPLKELWPGNFVTFDSMCLRFGKDKKINYRMPVIFLDTREIPISFHRHEFLEIVYVLEGKILSKNREDVVSLKAGDVWITRPEAEHALACYDGEATIVNICVPLEMFKEGVFKDFIQEEGLIRSLLKGEGDAPNYLYYPSQYNASYKRIVEQLLAEVNLLKKSPSSTVAVVLLLLSELSLKTKSRISSDDQKTVKILNYMERNYGTTSIKDIANHFGYTENYITRYIKQHTGQNASKLLVEIKLAKACELLVETDLSAETIGYKIGYKSSGHFYKLFKETYHITPMQFREMN